VACIITTSAGRRSRSTTAAGLHRHHSLGSSILLRDLRYPLLSFSVAAISCSTEESFYGQAGRPADVNNLCPLPMSSCSGHDGPSSEPDTVLAKDSGLLRYYHRAA
jgi:hypothetical protein